MMSKRILDGGGREWRYKLGAWLTRSAMLGIRENRYVMS